MNSSTVVVGTSATLIATGAGSSGTSVAIKTPTGGPIFIGASGVTTANGFPVDAGASISVDLEQGETVYGVAAAAVTVNVLTQG